MQKMINWIVFPKLSYKLILKKQTLIFYGEKKNILISELNNVIIFLDF